MTGARFIRSTIIIAVSSFLSRVLGLLRASLLASYYGATGSAGLSDCYAASFKLPDIIFNLVAFGAISIVLIPYFSGLEKKGNEDELKRSCSSFLNFFFVIISVFIVIGFVFAPYFVRDFLVKGWTDENNILLTIKMTRILLLQVLFMTLSGIFGSYLNAIERFTAYSFALLSYNLGIIAGILFIAPIIGIEGVAWGAVLGSFIHFAIQASGAVMSGFRYRFAIPKLSKDIRELIKLAVPRIIAISGEQFTKFFIVNFASFLFVGSIFIFENAENFSMVPFGMIAVSLSTTSFPVFSKLFVQKQYDKLLANLAKTLRAVIFFMLPVTLIMIILRAEIIELLLGYNRYSAQDVRLTAKALAFYMIGIPFFSVTIVVSKFYYANKKSAAPMVITVISSLITVAACYLFSKSYDVSGLSIGRSIGYALQAVLLGLGLIIINAKEKNFKKLPVKELWGIVKISASCAALFIPGILLERYVGFGYGPKMNALLKISVMGSVFSLVYIIACYMLNIPEIRYLFGKKNNID